MNPGKILVLVVEIVQSKMSELDICVIPTWNFKN